MRKRSVLLLCFLFLGLSLVAVGHSSRRTSVADEGPDDEVLDDHECLTCHGFRDNEDDAPFVNGHGFLASRHAKHDLDCTACHENHEDYPHPKDAEVLTAQCGECHDDAYEHVAKGSHAGLLGKDAEDPATTAACAACHGAHQLDAGCAECHDDTWDDLCNCIHLQALSETDHPRDPGSCIACHSGHQTTYNCGDCHEDVYDGIKQSVHGGLLGEPADLQTARTCIGCHGSPHGIPDVKDRAAPLHPFNIPKTCGACHFGERDLTCLTPEEILALVDAEPVAQTTEEILAQAYMDDTHGHALLKSGLLGAPTCVSCHGAHDIQSREDPESPVHPQNVSEDCGRCHLGILERYRESVHGRRRAEHAEGENGREAATCTDCHEPHGISRIDTPFKLQIIDTCSGCHGDAGATYRGTYHGRVTEIGFGGVASCDECHTAHDIHPSTDPASALHMANGNLTATCAKCHPGASDSFARYRVHVDPTLRPDPDHPDPWQGALYWIRRLMRGLIFATWAIWGVHMLLWLNRDWRDRKKTKSHLKPVSGRWYRRWPWPHRAIHLTLVISFLLLALTGLPLRFHEAGWSHVIFDVLGGPVAVRNLHRLGAILTFAYALAFIGMIVWRRVRGEKGLFRGPNSLLPRVKDLQDMKANLRYFVKGGEPPKFDRWTYWEKFDFIAEVWGVLVIGLTGLIMWYPIAFTRFLPGEVENIAHIVHSYEALLATTFIFSMHFFNANLRPAKFPVDPLFLTGRIPEEELRHERPLEYERMRRDGRLETEALPPPRPRRQRRAVVIGTVLLSVGILLLLLMVAAMAQYGVA